jgi:hypothetical protein
MLQLHGLVLLRDHLRDGLRLWGRLHLRLRDHGRRRRRPVRERLAEELRASVGLWVLWAGDAALVARAGLRGEEGVVWLLLLMLLLLRMLLLMLLLWVLLV